MRSTLPTIQNNATLAHAKAAAGPAQRDSAEVGPGFAALMQQQTHLRLADQRFKPTAAASEPVAWPAEARHVDTPRNDRPASTEPSTAVVAQAEPSAPSLATTSAPAPAARPNRSDRADEPDTAATPSASRRRAVDAEASADARTKARVHASAHASADTIGTTGTTGATDTTDTIGTIATTGADATLATTATSAPDASTLQGALQAMVPVGQPAPRPDAGATATAVDAGAANGPAALTDRTLRKAGAPPTSGPSRPTTVSGGTAIAPSALPAAEAARADTQGHLPPASPAQSSASTATGLPTAANDARAPGRAAQQAAAVEIARTPAEPAAPAAPTARTPAAPVAQAALAASTVDTTPAAATASPAAAPALAAASTIQATALGVAAPTTATIASAFAAAVPQQRSPGTGTPATGPEAQRSSDAASATRSGPAGSTSPTSTDAAAAHPSEPTVLLDPAHAGARSDAQTTPIRDHTLHVAEVGPADTASPTPMATMAPTGSPPAASPQPAPATPVHEARIAMPLDSPAFAPALGAQISLFARDGVQTALLQLNPAEMGPISVQIALDGSVARVDFQADLAGTRAVIEASLPALAGALQDAGLTLTGGGVFQHASGRQGQEPPPASATWQRRTSRDTDGGPAGPLPATHVRARRGLVDLVA